jgi:dTDP-4-amino-4,6-dideoxygalactose transaminase
MSNIIAAIGRGQLEVLEERVAAKRKIYDYYFKALNKFPGIEFMPEADYGRSNRWLTCLTVDPEKFGTDHETLRKRLEADNIEARPLWKPMHRQPVFAGYEKYGGEVAEDLFNRGLCLPSGTAMTQLDLDRVIDIIRQCRG